MCSPITATMSVASRTWSSTRRERSYWLIPPFLGSVQGAGGKARERGAPKGFPRRPCPVPGVLSFQLRLGDAGPAAELRRVGEGDYRRMVGQHLADHPAQGAGAVPMHHPDTGDARQGGAI